MKHLKNVITLFAILNGFIVLGCPDQEEGLQLWSETSSWDSQTLPASGSVVNIDRPILLDVTYLTLKQLNIVGNGRLVFSDQVGEITVVADGILVQDSGTLVIGSEDCRFQNTVNLRLTGTRTSDRSKISSKGEKFIAVTDEGSLQIYGQEKLAWTKLSQTVNRWMEDEALVVYSHATSPYHFETDIWNEGLAMYIFYDCNEQPKYYRVFDFDQNGNTQNEQRVVSQMIAALAGVEDGEIVAIATQRRYRTTANVTELYEVLESMSGITRLALRDAQDHDAYSLVLQKGGEAQEAFDPMIGKNGQVARTSIVVKDNKVTAVSTMKFSKNTSRIDFRIVKDSVGFPTISVIDDISTWQAGRYQ